MSKFDVSWSMTLTTQETDNAIWSRDGKIEGELIFRVYMLKGENFTRLFDFKTELLYKIPGDEREKTYKVAQKIHTLRVLPF